MKREHLSLMQRCLENVAAEDEYAEFAALLKEEPELLALYAEEINTIADLEWYHAIESNIKDSVRRKGELADEMRRYQHSQARWIGVAAAAAIMLFAFIYGSHRLLEARPYASLKVSPEASWSVRNAAGEIVQGSQLHKGYKVHLRRGLMDIEFQDGVSGTLEGPARLEFADRKLVQLSEGRLFINLQNEDGKNFTVETPELKAIDLGTRFGVTSSPDAGDEVHVQEGSVMVISKTGAAMQKLLQMQALKLMPDGELARIPEKSLAFLDSIHPEFPPYIHWSFDILTPEGFPSEGTLPGATSFPATLVYLREKVSPSAEPGKIGGALSLHGQGDFAETQFPAFSKKEAFSITGWFKADKSDMSSQAGTPRRNLLSWGTFSSDHDADGVAIDFPQYISKETAFSTVLGTPNSRTIYGKNYLDSDWHHFASVATGNRRSDGAPEILQYIDGELLASEVDFVAHPTTSAMHLKSTQPLRFGIAAVPLTPEIPTFATSIDEIRIFQGALAESQVRNLFSENIRPLKPREQP